MNGYRAFSDKTWPDNVHSTFLKELARYASKSLGSPSLVFIGMKSWTPTLEQNQNLADYRPTCKPKLRPGSQLATLKAYVRDKSSWESLTLDEALTSLEQTDELPSIEDFICILQKCRKRKILAYTKRVIIHIQDSGLEAHEALGNFLVPALVECGSMVDAEHMFHRLIYQNVYSWSSLIQGYIEHGEFQHAFNLLLKMQENHVHPSGFTFQAVVKACARLQWLERGQEIHTEVVKEGFELDPFVGSTLLDMYAKCGSLAEAQELFNEMPVQDVVSWTALIGGYAEHGLGEEALHCFDTMQIEGVPADAGTFVCSLKGCASLNARDRGLKIHAEVVKEGFEGGLLVGSALLDMYVKCGALADAWEVFEELPSRDAIAWTSLISGYAERKLGEEALKCLEMMQVEGLSPDAGSLVCSLKACGSIKELDRGKELHAQIVKLAFERDAVVGTGLVDMYSKFGAHGEARAVFNHLPVRDVVSWTALTGGYAEYGLGDEALIYLEQMQLEGVSPNDSTFSCTLKACVRIGAIDKGQEMHAEIVKEGFEKDPFIASSLVDMYSKYGSLAEAQEIFDELPARGVVTWSTLIAGYTRRGEIEVVFHLLEKMREDGIRPEGMIFLSVLTVCSHAGLVDKGQKYFEAMSKECKITPTIEHLNAMVDLLGRAGRLEEAVMMLEKMPLQPTLVTWSTLLSACRMWGNVDIGKHAFESALRLNEKDGVLFSLMSNIYADAHMWEDAKKIETMRLNVGASKKQEKSWIETSGCRPLSVVRVLNREGITAEDIHKHKHTRLSIPMWCKS